MLHSFSFARRRTKRNGFSALLVPVIGTMIGFSVKTGPGGFKTFARAVQVGSVTQLLAPYLWFDHDLGEISVLGSRGGGNALFEQRTSLEDSITPKPDGSGGDSAALHRSTEGHRAFFSLAYFSSCSYSLTPSAHL